MRLSKRESFDRGKALLAQGTDEALRYACLEFRFCIEAISYEKLKAYAKRIPPDVIATWQPRKAVQALLELEPLADQSHRLTLYPQDENGRPGGPAISFEHKALSLAVIRRYYDRLGSYLHVPQSSKALPGAEYSEWMERLRETLTELVADLEPIVRSNFDSSFSNVVYLDCHACGRKMISNPDGARKSHRAACVHCGARYHVSEAEGGEKLRFQLIATVLQCQRCGSSITVENRFLDIGYEFACQSCKAVHRIDTRQWVYGLLEHVAKGEDGGA